jgi:hypothetical protein
MVAILTVHRSGNDGGAGAVSIDEILQGNSNGSVYPPTSQELPHLLLMANAGVGRSYIVFTSFNRGGACPSALFGYQPSTQVATFLSQNDGPGPGGQISLPGRVTTIPVTVDLATLRTRLFPTGGVTYPVGAGESSCPGP